MDFTNVSQNYEAGTKVLASQFVGSIISVVGKTTVEITELFKCTQKVP